MPMLCTSVVSKRCCGTNKAKAPIEHGDGVEERLIIAVSVVFLQGVGVVLARGRIDGREVAAHVVEVLLHFLRSLRRGLSSCLACCVDCLLSLPLQSGKRGR